MTAQAGERLLIDNKEVWMATEPLEPYLKTRKIRFVRPSTACWRGYYAKWEIIDNKLFLISLEAYIERSKAVGMDYLFPGYETVFAEWFTGEIRIPEGEMLQYIHMGYSSTFEKDLFLEFESGILVSKRVVENEMPPEPYKITAADFAKLRERKPKRSPFWRWLLGD